jgi:hypothetical protein
LTRLGDELRAWVDSEGERTVGGLIEVFGEKSFAVLFIFLLGLSALPVPTGGVTNVLELIAMLVAVQLMVGRKTIWLPRRWRAVTLAGGNRERLVERLLSLVVWLERRSRGRGHQLFGTRAGSALFGALVLIGSVGAFVAPPFSGLDTLPSLGVVVLSIGFLVEDVLIAGAGVAIGAGGIALIVTLGRAALRGLADLV